jgi:hypothetical protein
MCREPSKHPHLKGAPLAHRSHGHLYAIACAWQFFWIETIVLLEVLVASSKVAYGQLLSSPCHTHH